MTAIDARTFAALSPTDALLREYQRLTAAEATMKKTALAKSRRVTSQLRAALVRRGVLPAEQE